MFIKYPHLLRVERVDTIEQFMEWKNGDNGIDNARHRLFVKVKRDLEMLPPTTLTH